MVADKLSRLQLVVVHDIDFDKDFPDLFEEHVRTNTGDLKETDHKTPQPKDRRYRTCYNNER